MVHQNTIRTNNGFFGALYNRQTPREIDNYGDNKILIAAAT